MSSILSRRQFLRTAALSAGAVLLGACTKTVKETVIQEKEVTREVEVVKEVTKVVEQTVVQQKEVTKVVEKVVTATPAPKPLKLIWLRADSECAQYTLARETPLVFEWYQEATGIEIDFDVVAQ